jgi:hypothetical protein
MRELPAENWMLYGITLAVVCVGTPLLHKVPRSQGKQPLFHILFLVAAAALLLLVPSWVQDELFSPGGVLLIGTLVPIYESVLAVCSLDAADDVAWLQFWIASATFSFATEFMDEITEQLPQAGEHWYEFEFFFTLWLALPMTDGAGLLYEKVTLPYIRPLAEKLKTQLEGYMNMIMTMVNTSYIWFMWYAFIRMPEDQRRFLVVCLGTVYPLVSSTVALSTTSTKKNGTERYWLTYWSIYSIMFILMDYLENFVGHIRGFYTLCACATLYLFLPMFQGSDVIFRRVLVPLSGQYENLLLHDAYLVKMGMEESLPGTERARVMAMAAELFKTKTN